MPTACCGRCFTTGSGCSNFRRDTFEGYLRVNAAFAAALAPLLQPDDLVWVHDYHLIPLGAELRKLGVQNRIGFFLHIPFPTDGGADRAARPRETGSSRLRLRSDRISERPTTCAPSPTSRHEGARRSGVRRHVRAFGRRGRAGAFPISIDTDGFARAAEHAAGAPDMKRMSESLVGRALIIGVDRLDYSKGLPHSFRGLRPADGALARAPVRA